MLLPLLLASGLSAAHAAEVTDLPQPLRGMAALDYSVTGDATRLVEGDTQVGARQERSHTLSLQGAFSPVQGVALAFSLPYVVDQRLSWSMAQQMSFDPILGMGSMVGTDPIDPPPVEKGHGLAGPLLAVQLTPFNADLFHNGFHRTTWLLEGGFRFQDKSSFFAERDDGSRGAGPGGAALHLRTAFSTTRQQARPYVQASFDRAFTVATDLRDADHAVVVAGAPVRPASRLDFRVGAEVPVKTGPELAVSLDVRGRFGYRSWQDIPSGLYLPDVLAASREVLVTQGEALHATGGLGLQLRFPGTADLLVGGDCGVESPYRVEHPYRVRTDLGTVVWQAHLAVRVWIDDKILGLTAAEPDAAQP